MFICTNRESLDNLNQASFSTSLFIPLLKQHPGFNNCLYCQWAYVTVNLRTITYATSLDLINSETDAFIQLKVNNGIPCNKYIHLVKSLGV